MAENPNSPKSELHLGHFALQILGGLCLGSGLIDLCYSFGWPGGGLNGNFDLIGWSALDNIETLPASGVAIPLVVVGALCMILGNATAWKETGGY